MDTYVHPDYHLTTCMLLNIYKPQPQENQEIMTPSTSRAHIRLYYYNITNLIDVSDGNLVFESHRERKVQSRVYVCSEALDKDLVTVLLNWEVPVMCHDEIVESVVETLSTLDTSLLPQTPCVFHVDLTRVSCYSSNPDAFREWESESDVPESDYDGMVPTSEEEEEEEEEERRY